MLLLVSTFIILSIAIQPDFFYRFENSFENIGTEACNGLGTSTIGTPMYTCAQAAEGSCSLVIGAGTPGAFELLQTGQWFATQSAATISFKLRVTSNSYNGWSFLRNENYAAQAGFHVHRNDSAFNGELATSAMPYGSEPSVAAPIAPMVWHHYHVKAYKAPVQWLEVYLNGSLLWVTNQKNVFSTHNFVINAGPNGLGNALLDELMIFKGIVDLEACCDSLVAPVCGGTSPPSSAPSTTPSASPSTPSPTAASPSPPDSTTTTPTSSTSSSTTATSTSSSSSFPLTTTATTFADSSEAGADTPALNGAMLYLVIAAAALLVCGVILACLVAARSNARSRALKRRLVLCGGRRVSQVSDDAGSGAASRRSNAHSGASRAVSRRASAVQQPQQKQRQSHQYVTFSGRKRMSASFSPTATEYGVISTRRSSGSSGSKYGTLLLDTPQTTLLHDYSSLQLSRPAQEAQQGGEYIDLRTRQYEMPEAPTY